MALALAAFAMFAFAPAAQANVAWYFAPAKAPSPPPGVASAPYPVPLGEVGQISFWAPNRGVLITGGTEAQGGPVPAGLYAYDGANWHLLSKVCGGGKGRIAWAGPDEFWSIADQRPGQTVLGAEVENELPARSLCHFVGGRVVASYAEPLGQPDSYLKMDAAACYSPSDCWFAGSTGEPPDLGSFHLHWDGSALNAIYDASDHAVTGMVNFGGQLYEGLGIGPQDAYLPTEETGDPAVLRRIAPAGATSPCKGVLSTFCDVVAFWEAAERSLPIYPNGVAPDGLVGFSLASDGSPLGVGATQLWAGADPVAPAPAGTTPASVTILRSDRKGEWTQLLPARETDGKSVGSPLGEAQLAGSTSYISPERHDEFGAGAIAPMPGSESAWLSLSTPSGDAVVALLGANGEVKLEHLPRPEEPVGVRGRAGPIACAAPNDCWMATDQGWLFHLTDGTSYGIDTDPDFAGVISVRPPDEGLPAIYPDLPPVDDSLANQQPAPPTGAPEQTPASAKPKHKSRPLVMRVKSKFLHGHVLVLSFTLTARARVRLVGRRGKRVVVSTAPASLRPGRHTLSLSLDPRRWPTKLQFQAKPIGAHGPSGGSEGGGDTISTG